MRASDTRSDVLPGLADRDGSSPPSAMTPAAFVTTLQRSIGNRATARLLATHGRRTLARQPVHVNGDQWTDPHLPGVALTLRSNNGGKQVFSIQLLGGETLTLIYGPDGHGGNSYHHKGSVISADAVMRLVRPPFADLSTQLGNLLGEFRTANRAATSPNRLANWQARLHALELHLRRFGVGAGHTMADLRALRAEMLSAQSRYLRLRPIALATESFYGSVALDTDAVDNAPTLRQETATGTGGALDEPLNVRILPCAGAGLRWWGCAAMALRWAASHVPAGRIGEIRILRVAGRDVRILVRAANAAQQIPAGEFIVLGETTGIQNDAASGLQTARLTGLDVTREADLRVSYMAFTERLARLANQLPDHEIATLLLALVRQPAVVPLGTPPGLLPLMCELLVTILVAEPARHRSILFNSVLTLEAIADRRLLFWRAFADDGAFAMTGGGTAAHGRASELQEATLRQAAAVPANQAFNPVTRRQTAQFSDDPQTDVAALVTRYG
jgi:hypothetical protein